MEDQIQRLAQKLTDKVLTSPPTTRHLISISGLPGSGKSTFTLSLLLTLNAKLLALPSFSSVALSPVVSLPMDGFHLTRAQLSALPNAEEAHRRRGAHWTFDSRGLLDFLRRVRKLPVPGPGEPVKVLEAPSFDHSRKDPVEGDICILSSARVVLVEGNYLCLNEPVWEEIAECFDERWFVECEREVATQRLVERHLRSGVCKSREEAEERARGSDWENGTEILGKLLDVDERIMSVEEGKRVGKTEGEVEEQFGECARTGLCRGGLALGSVEVGES